MANVKIYKRGIALSIDPTHTDKKGTDYVLPDGFCVAKSKGDCLEIYDDSNNHYDIVIIMILSKAMVRFFWSVCFRLSK